MGACCSNGRRYSPYETLRECQPDKCWCQGSHRYSKYMYVERGSNGQERYHDPYDYINNRMLTGGGLPGDWKDPGEWTVRDVDRLGGILSEYNRRAQGQPQMFGGVGGGAAPWMGPVTQVMPWMAGGPGGGVGMPAVAMMMRMADNPFLKMPRDNHRSNRRSSWEDEIMQRIKRMEEIAKEYEERMTSMRNHLYGSDADRQEELYKQRQNKLWQEFQQAQMQSMMGMGGVVNGLGGAGIGGMGMGMAMPQGNPMMAAPQGFAGGGGMCQGMQGFGGMGQMGGFGGMNGMGGFGMGEGAAGMMDPRQAQMMGSMGGMGGLGNGGGMGFGMGRRGGRRARRNLGFSGDDDYDDEDFGGGGGGGGGGFGGGRRRRRRGGFDDGDLFGGGFGDGRPSPRGPAGGPRRPMRPDRGDGPSGGGRGAGPDNDRGFFNEDPPMRTGYSPDILARRAAAAPPMQQRPATAEPSRAESPMRGAMPGSPPPGMHMRPSKAGAPGEQAPPPGAIPIQPGGHTGPGAADVDPYHTFRSAYGGRESFPPYASGAGPPYGGGDAGPDTTQRTSAGPGHVGFDFGPEAKLARTRDDEEMRGETDAGAQPGPRDIK
ncbi:hypothetical protein LTR85_010095 [Meristemomyces frigidus]|nr:hypothetical protein LTR85_010095 [Meristemomyces frigidus]